MKRAFVQYKNGTLVSSVLLIRDEFPTGDGWVEVPSTLCCSSISLPAGNANLKGWIKFSGAGEVVSHSTIIRKKRPTDGTWLEIPYKRCC
jgi:hypothetical protein